MTHFYGVYCVVMCYNALYVAFNTQCSRERTLSLFISGQQYVYVCI